jgi:hypothetical protein
MEMFMLDRIDQLVTFFQLAWAWLIAQPLPLQLGAGIAGLAVLWVLWILLRITLAALRGAFRGL